MGSMLGKVAEVAASPSPQCTCYLPTLLLRFSDGTSTSVIFNPNNKTVKLMHNTHANVRADLLFHPRGFTPVYPKALFTDPQSTFAVIVNHPATVMQMIRNTNGKGEVVITDNCCDNAATYTEKHGAAMRADLQNRIDMMVNLYYVSQNVAGL